MTSPQETPAQAIARAVRTGKAVQEGIAGEARKLAAEREAGNRPQETRDGRAGA